MGIGQVKNVIDTIDKLQLLVGEDVMELLSDKDFLIQWENLYQSCDWATIYQSPDFVVDWYEIYHKTNIPILVYIQSDGRLTGLITLAQGSKNSEIMGAGRQEAQYQTWISEDFNKESFMKEALQLVRSQFMDKKIILHLPSNAPFEWIQSDPDLSSYCKLDPLKRHLLNLNASEIDRLLKKKQFRLLRNRLKKIGNLHLEEVTDPERFLSIMEELTTQYDLRQGAVHTRTPYRSNPLRTMFYFRLFQRKKLLLVLLKLDDEVIGSLISIVGKNGWVHGLRNTQSPYYSKFSPGIINLSLSFKFLFETKYAVFDFSTGGQVYKDRLASDIDYVYELTVSAQKSLKYFKLKNLIKPNLKGLLPKKVSDFHIKNSESFARKIIFLSRNCLFLVRKHGFLNLLKGALKSSEKIYNLNESSIHLPDMYPISLNKKVLKDFLDFEPDGLGITKQAFLGNVLERIEEGEIPFTWKRDGKLMACIWLGGTLIFQKNSNFSQSFLQEDAIWLHGLYFHSEALEALDQFIEKAHHETAKQYPNKRIFIWAKSEIEAFCPNIEVVEF